MLIPRDLSQITKAIDLWHCHLSHINRHAYLSKSCLGSFDLESYETCESCLSGR